MKRQPPAVDRRAALRRFRAFVAGSPAEVPAQDGLPAIRLAPVAEIVAAQGG